MAIEVEITGTGRFAGHKSNIGSYSYSEESTPAVIGDDSGGVGTISFSAADNENDGIVLYRDNIMLTDDRYGSITGRIDSLTSTDGVINISASSRLALINTIGTVTAGEYTLRGLLREILEAADITDDIAFSPLIDESNIAVPAYRGDLWVFLKQACTAYGVQVALINNTIYFEPTRLRTITIENISSATYALQDAELSQSFDVAYYNYDAQQDILVYPYGGWNAEVDVQSVRANETVTFEVEVNGYLTAIEQPTAQNTVAKNYTGPNSVYSISGNDGLPITAAQWTAQGGSLTGELIENGTKIKFTLVGADFESLSPFKVAVSDGATEYSTLRIIGTGVLFDRKLYNVKTGLTPDLAPQEKGQEIDNPFVDTLQQAIDLGIKARRNYALPRQTFDAAGRSFLQKNYTQYDYFELDSDEFGLLDGEAVLGFVNPANAIAFYQDFDTYNNSLPSPYTFTDFNNDYVDATFEDFANSVAETFSQAFGFVAGSRLQYYDAFYRVRSTEISANGVSISSEFDTLFSDFNTAFDGYTFEQFDEIMITLDFTDYSLMPLRKDPYNNYDYLFLDEGELDVNVLGFLG